MDEEVCYRCKQANCETLDLTCKHKICKNCILRVILKKFLLDLPDKETLIIPCKCRNGSIELQLQKILDLVNNKNDSILYVCKNHGLDYINYCSDCRKYLCEKCMISHNDLFTKHNIETVSEEFLKNINNQSLQEKCPHHNKDFNNYCHTCKECLCSICLNDPIIMQNHQNHDISSYENLLKIISEQREKLQFRNWDGFNKYLEKMEKEFDDIYNNNLERTCTVLEGFINVISKLLKDYKERMELKFNKKITVMNIIKKVYETYYNDFEDCKKGIKNIYILKYLCKPYSEFSEINFYSDLDKITDTIEEIKNTVENTEISSVARFSYSYFSKRSLKLSLSINDQFKGQINDLIEINGDRIMAASEDSNIKIFNKKGECLYILKGHLRGVRALCLLEDSFASGSADKTTKIWDLKTFKIINTLKEHTNPVINVNYLYDSKMLATCSLREVIIYDHKYKARYRLQDNKDFVRAFISLDNLKYCSCSDDGTVKLYDKHFRVLNTMKDHNQPVLCAVHLRDERIITGDKGGNVIIWNKGLNYGKQIKLHNGAINCIKQLKDGRIITGSNDKTVNILDLNFSVLKSFHEHKGKVLCVLPMKDGSVVSGGSDNIINIFG